MKNNYMIGIPIETITLRNGEVISAIKTQYKDTLNTYLPKTVYSFASKIPVSQNQYFQYYVPEYTINKYNKNGDIIQLAGKDDVPVVYLWGYGNQYPIAEIKGVTYDRVKSVIAGGETAINLLAVSYVPDMNIVEALRNSLPDALITTYTYKPLVGMISSIDPMGSVSLFYHTDYLWHS